MAHPSNRIAALTPMADHSGVAMADGPLLQTEVVPERIDAATAEPEWRERIAESM